TGQPVDAQAVTFYRLLAVNPTVLSLSEVPPELTDIMHAPAAPAEQSLLLEALALAKEGLAETRRAGDVERRGEYARIIAVIAQRRFDDSDEAVHVVTAMRAE